MPFKKGHSKEGGRKKGVENKTTKDIREAFKALIEMNLDNMTDWLKRVAKDNPSRALDHMQGLSEYIIPKLQRTELVGDKDKPIIWQETKSYISDSDTETDPSA